MEGRTVGRKQHTKTERKVDRHVARGQESKGARRTLWLS